ncbi:SNF2 family N-terminal domain-containing protein [Podospora aff. communis PSN243]|uniref:SNF2 family N-terminal domain-containing protein n=1 Tax=Podospora aff. communis PSN243 TaxID=3040156 RepID=A0AAV9G988_9PEZI|nr:SNF2 family N-terminal domain-containing protein [Podospora aff. communis PSN243]
MSGDTEFQRSFYLPAAVNSSSEVGWAENCNENVPDFQWKAAAGCTEEGSLELHVQYLAAAPASGGSSIKTCQDQVQSARLSLSITMYGLMHLCEEIGEFFESNEMFIQDPDNCNRRARYCNPHRLSSADPNNFQWTSDLDPADITFEVKDVTAGSDILDLLDSQADLAETPQPPAIETILKRHQKQALTFMIAREKGWTFDENVMDLWDVIDTGSGRFFINRISGTHQNEEPQQFHGGIVADPMGFGKTLTTIALVATDVCDSRSLLNDDPFHDYDTGLDVTNASQTLIVVPPPLLDTWEEQLAEHVIPGGLTWMRYHGKSRTSQSLDFTQSNIVLTTYHTVAADRKNKGNAQSSVLFSTRWKRLVLDEAHVIRNSNSQMARSIQEINAKCRWAVTGTPIQNRLKDFPALLKFLQVDPYSNQRDFDRDISHLLKTEQVDEARKRLQRLSRCLLLRRPQGTVQLPPRTDLECEVAFSPAERELYDSIRNRAIEQIDSANSQGGDASPSSTYMNVLQQIEAMRLVCNLGLHYSSRHNHSSGDAAHHSRALHGDWIATAQRMFNLRRNISPVQCGVCGLSLETIERLLVDDEKRPSLFSQCLQFMCSDCVQTAKDRCHCIHTPRCKVAPISVAGVDMEEPAVAHWGPNVTQGVHYARLPTKVAALVSQLRKVPLDEKSLTLTVASRAYLLEPHWNPTLEDQALARIHRMGQKREVTTVRFFVRDTFEKVSP